VINLVNQLAEVSREENNITKALSRRVLNENIEKALTRRDFEQRLRCPRSQFTEPRSLAADKENSLAC
jgi:hypothetical protein